MYLIKGTAPLHSRAAQRPIPTYNLFLHDPASKQALVFPLSRLILFTKKISFLSEAAPKFTWLTPADPSIPPLRRLGYVKPPPTLTRRSPAFVRRQPQALQPRPSRPLPSDMASTRERRIAKELADIHNDKDNSGVAAQPIDLSNLTHLKGTFPGPPDSPYAGGTFQVDIKIPDNYPFKSPIMKFDTKIWHPNVSSVTVGFSTPVPPLPRRARMLSD